MTDNESEKAYSRPNPYSDFLLSKTNRALTKTPRAYDSLHPRGDGRNPLASTASKKTSSLSLQVTAGRRDQRTQARANLGSRRQRLRMDEV